VATSTTVAATATAVAAEVDGCAGAANDISLVEMWPGQKQSRNEASVSSSGSGGNSKGSCQNRRRRSGSGKCIWPTTEWLRKLRNQSAAAGGECEPGGGADNAESGRRGSVLLMVLLSTSDEVKAKTILVSGQQPQSQPEVALDEDVEDAVDALWL
ncbi:hypothetical protein KR018_002411, partial [Drosophila ironensis]